MCRDAHSHELALLDIKDFFSVSAPARRNAAVTRDLPLLASFGEVANIDLVPTGLVGYVHDEIAVGRELAATFVEGSFQIRDRFAKASIVSTFAIQDRGFGCW